jgi:hypothetical protein
MTYERFSRWIVLAALAAGLVYAAALAGWLQHVIVADGTGIVWGTMGLAGLTFATAAWTSEFIDWACEHGLTLLLGLLGTLTGFMAALSGVTDGDIVQKLAGIETALSTTVVGLVCHLWLIAAARALR